MIVSPNRHAGRLSMRTVCEPSITTPGPWGGIGNGVTHACLSAIPATEAIIEAIDVAAVAFVVSSAAFAAGAPGVPAAASVAASATLIVVSETVFADWIAAAAPAGTP